LFSDDEETLTLEQCIVLALKNNHLYKSQQYEFSASRARMRQAWAFPQPEISFDSDLQPRMFDFKKSGESYLGITQSIEFPGRRYLRGKIASNEWGMAASELESVRKEIIYNVKISFYEILLNQEIRKYAEENQQMADDFLAKATEKYQSGDVSKLEVLRAKVEAARATNRLEVAVNQVKSARARLNFFLARDRYQPLDIRGNLRGPIIEPDLKELQVQALASRPEIKKERLAIKKESLAKKQALLGFLPDVSLGVSRHRITGEPNTWDVTVSFQAPLFFWQKINGEIAEARANLAAAEERLKYLEFSISLEIENAYYNVVSLRNQVELFEKEALTEAEQVYRMALESYQEGKTGSIESIEARRSLVDLRQSYAETLFNYRAAIAELEKSLGAPLGGSEENDE
jgi:cobalt-zinc-cadmium efflux system outer membrane protein